MAQFSSKGVPCLRCLQLKTLKSHCNSIQMSFRWSIVQYPRRLLFGDVVERFDDHNELIRSNLEFGAQII